jgi:hypothetical protein
VDSDTPIDGISTNFQRFSCSIEAASKIYSHRVDSLHDLALYFNKSLTSDGNDITGGEYVIEGETNQNSTLGYKLLLRNRVKSKTIEEDESTAYGQLPTSLRPTFPSIR